MAFECAQQLDADAAAPGAVVLVPLCLEAARHVAVAADVAEAEQPVHEAAPLLGRHHRPDVVGDPNANVPTGLAFNPAAFRLPAVGAFGNAGRNIIRGDGFHSVDISLFKNFSLSDQMKLQFRTEAVNSFNHVNYQGPAVNLNATAGEFVAAAQPRIIQFGLKLTF